MRPLSAFALFAVVFLAAPSTLRADDEDPRLTLGKSCLTLMTQSKYEEFCAKGDEMMKSGFSTTRAKLTWERLEAQLGKFVALESAAITTQGENATVNFVWRFERGTAAGRLHLDKGDRVSGFWFDRMEMKIPPPPYADGARFKEETISVTAGALALPGRLAIPSVPGPHPAVVLLHAYGAHDLDETMGAVQVFRDLAWGLATNEVAVLRYDKRNRAFPTATQPADWTLESESLEDARAALQYLRERPEIDKSRIFVLGHGLGATAAVHLAREDKRLAGLVLLTPPGRLPVDQLEDEVAYLANLDGVIDERDQAQITFVGNACQRIRNDDAASVQELVMGQPARYWAELCRYQCAEVAARLELPIFAAHGGRDYKVNAKDAAVWKKLAEAHRNITWQDYPGLNNQLVKGEGRSTPDDLKITGVVDEKLLRDVLAWIRAPSSGGAPAAASAPTSAPASRPAEAK